MSDQSATPDHDGFCERIEVDIGVGIQESPCYCHIRQLERELAEAKAEAQRLLDRVVGLIDEREQAERRAAELERDARRYRWLRELPNADSLNVRFVGVDLDNVIDAVIDAAIASGAGESK